ISLFKSLFLLFSESRPRTAVFLYFFQQSSHCCSLSRITADEVILLGNINFQIVKLWTLLQAVLYFFILQPVRCRFSLRGDKLPVSKAQGNSKRLFHHYFTSFFRTAG